CGSAGGIGSGRPAPALGWSVISRRCAASEVAAVGGLLAPLDEVDRSVEAADTHDLEREGVDVEAAAPFAGADEHGEHVLGATGRVGHALHAHAVDADLVLRRHAAGGDDEEHLARE